MRKDSIKLWPWILIVSFSCFSCSQKSNDSEIKGSSTAINGGPVSDTKPPKRGENAVDLETNGNRADAPEAWFYTTIGDSRFKTFNEITNSRVLSSKTFDEAGKLKWMDVFSYGQDSSKPAEMRRIKPDGSVFQVLYIYSEDGHQTRMVIGPDGKQIPAEKQDSVLNQ